MCPAPSVALISWLDVDAGGNLKSAPWWDGRASVSLLFKRLQDPVLPPICYPVNDTYKLIKK